MQAQALSKDNAITMWNVFETDKTKSRYVIGYSSTYKFDVITQELASFNYDQKSKTGTAVTKTGSVYTLDGKPMRFNPKGHMLLREFMEKHDCQISFVST